jgi:hypothetical protein
VKGLFIAAPPESLPFPAPDMADVESKIIVPVRNTESAFLIIMFLHYFRSLV